MYQMTKQVLINPILHPSGIIRGRWSLEPCQIKYLTRINKCIQERTPPPLVDINQPPPRSNLFPTPTQVETFVTETQTSLWDAIGVDIESAGRHIICIGLTQLSLGTGEIGRTICVRFRRRGGSVYWSSTADLGRVVESCDDLLEDSDIAMVFHNGTTYDVPILEGVGFRVQGRLIDTMLLAHSAWSEIPKSLQFTSTLHLWSPVWKLLTEVSDEDEGKG